MFDWQITATTIYCDAVDDEVTVMVFKDRSIKCTGTKKVSQKKTRRQPACSGSDCPKVTAYRDKLFAEEPGKK